MADQWPDPELRELQGVGFASYMARDADDEVAQGLLDRIYSVASFGDLSPADQRLLTLWVRDFQHGNCDYAPEAWASLDYGEEDEAAERLGIADGDPVPFSAIPYPSVTTPPVGDDGAEEKGLSGADFGPWVGL